MSRGFRATFDEGAQIIWLGTGSTIIVGFVGLPFGKDEAVVRVFGIEGIGIIRVLVTSRRHVVRRQVVFNAPCEQ